MDKEMIGKSVYEGIHADDIIKVQDYLARAQRELPTEQNVRYSVPRDGCFWQVAPREDLCFEPGE